MPYHFAGRQRVFETIGPCTRAGFFTRNGELLTIKQDVGHRNAVGKLIRWATERNRVPLRGSILLVSWRVSFEPV